MGCLSIYIVRITIYTQSSKVYNHHGVSAIKFWLSCMYKLKVKKRNLFESKLTERPDVRWVQQQKVLKRIKRSIGAQDPLYPFMWYLNPGFNSTDQMNITGAWKQGANSWDLLVFLPKISFLNSSMKSVQKVSVEKVSLSQFLMMVTVC